MVDHSRQLIYQQNVYLLKMYFPVKFIYIYRQMVDICECVCMYVYVCYYLYIWARWVVEIMKIWQLINFNYIYCQNFRLISMKTKFILCFLFIMITLVSLHNIHVLNYTRNIFLKKLHTKHQKTFSNSFSRSLPNTW